MANQNLLDCLLDDPSSTTTDGLTPGDERTPLLIQQSAVNHNQHHDYTYHNFQHHQASNSMQQPPPTPPQSSGMQFSLRIQGEDDDLPISDSLGSGTSVIGSRHCHSDETERHSRYVAAQKIARRRLLIASCACLVFMIGEIIGGAIANSLAIMTDAAHLLTDLASFLISLLALFLATRQPSRRMSFGWYRAEVLGALISVLMIWLVTGVLVYLAVRRVVFRDFEVEGKPMLITAGAGVAFNVLMALLLHQGHGHSHGSQHQHSSPPQQHHHHHQHAATPVDHQAVTPIDSPAVDSSSTADSAKEQEEPPEPAGVELSDTTSIVERDSRRRHRNRNHHHPQHEHQHQHHQQHEHVGGGFGHNHSHNNMNVRAAFIHVLGDLLQSIGVLIAAFVIYYRPDYKLADPICTFVFSLLVMGTTIGILRDTLRVLMEATPLGVNVVAFRTALSSLPGVVQVHSLRVWSLTLGRNVASAHLAVDPTCSVAQRDTLVVKATELAKTMHQFSDVTLQVEPHVVGMDSCEHCRSV